MMLSTNPLRRGSAGLLGNSERYKQANSRLEHDQLHAKVLKNHVTHASLHLPD
jgi:hypothetical protein